jgi:hypothetical protein
MTCVRIKIFIFAENQCMSIEMTCSALTVNANIVLMKSTHLAVFAFNCQYPVGLEAKAEVTLHSNLVPTFRLMYRTLEFLAEVPTYQNLWQEFWNPLA